MFKIRFSRAIRQNTVTRTRENHLRQLLYSEAYKLNNVWARVTPVRFFFVKLSFLPYLFPFILHISFYFVQSESSQFLEFQGSSSKIWYGWTVSKFPPIAPMVVISRILTISWIKPIGPFQFCTPTEAQQKKTNQNFKAGNSSDIFRVVVPWNFGLLLTCFVLTDNLKLSLLQTLRIMATLSNGIPISNSIEFLFAQFLFSVNCSWEFVVKAVFFFIPTKSAWTIAIGRQGFMNRLNSSIPLAHSIFYVKEI